MRWRVVLFVVILEEVDGDQFMMCLVIFPLMIFFLGVFLLAPHGVVDHHGVNLFHR